MLDTFQDIVTYRR